VESRENNADAAFTCEVQHMQAVVYSQPMDAGLYTAAITGLHAEVRGANNPQGTPVFEATRTEAGWPCTRATVVGRVQNGGGPDMVSTAIVYWPEGERMFTVMLVGKYWSGSDANKTVLRETFTQAARDLQLSLGPVAVRSGPAPSASQADGVQ
jgi:hypothetical protein